MQAITSSSPGEQSQAHRNITFTTAPNSGDNGGEGTLYTGPAKGQKGAPEYYFSDGQAFYPEGFLDLGQQYVIKSVEDTEYWISSDATSTALRKIVVEVQPIEYKVVYHCNASSRNVKIFQVKFKAFRIFFILGKRKI